MRTIEKILRYHFTQEELKKLYEAGIINGCGGKGGFSFDNFINKTIPALPEVIQKKLKNFYKDVKKLCEEHDVDFRLGGGFLKFTLANLKFAKGIFKLLHWTKLWQRISGFIIIFVDLQKEGKKYFNFKNRPKKSNGQS